VTGAPYYGQFGLLDPTQQGYNSLLQPAPQFLAPAPYAPKPSIVDRVAARLFPTGAYEGLVDPTAQSGLQRQGLLNVGTSLMQAGGGRPYNPGTLANIGAALQGSQQNFPQMADRALQLQAYQSQLAQQRAIAQASAAHPPQPGETASDTYKRLAAIITDISTVPGGDAIAGKLAPVLAALKPEKGQEPQRITGIVDTRLGSPTLGKTGDFLIPYPGAPRETWTFIQGKPETPKEPTYIERQAGQQAAGMATAADRMKQIEDEHPEVADKVAGIIAAGKVPLVGKWWEGVRSLGLSDLENEYLTNANTFLTEAVRTASGRAGQPTPQAMAAEAATTLPTLREGDASRVTKQANRLQRIAEAMAKAGKAAVPVRAPAAPKGPPAAPAGNGNPFAPGGQYYVGPS